MASLRVMEDQPTRLVLGKGGVSGLGSLIGIIIFGVLALVGLGLVFEEGGELNPVMLVIVLVIGFVGLATVLRSITSSRVTLDADQKIAARTDSLFFIPTRQQALAFNLVRDVAVTSPGKPDALSMDSAPVWQVALRGADGSSLVVNDRGTRAEMNSLAEQVGVLVGRPLKSTSEFTQPATSAALTLTAAGVFGSLTQNLATFAESLGPAGTTMGAPTISAYSSDPPLPSAAERQSPNAPYAQASARMTADQIAAGASGATANVQMAADRASAFSSDVQAQLQMGASQLAAGAPIAATNLQMTANRASAFSSDVQVQSQLGAAQLAAGAPFTEASARLAQQQAQGQAAMGFSMPSMLTMPQMPPMLSMGPSLNMPSFAPMGVAFDLIAAPVPVTPATKQVVLQEPDIAADNGPLFIQARKLQNARNYRDAEKAYLTALSTNPADAAAQNDLGVVYYAENKLREAESAFRRAMALDPFNIEARYNLGLVLNRQGKRTAAQEIFRVGAQTAGRADSKHFQEALRGVLHDPLTSAR